MGEAQKEEGQLDLEVWNSVLRNAGNRELLKVADWS